MSSNVPPYQVDLIVAAAVGHSVLSIFAIESQVQGGQSYAPPPLRDKYLILMTEYLSSVFYFHDGFQNDS